MMKRYKNISCVEEYAALNRLICEPFQTNWTTFNAVHDWIHHARNTPNVSFNLSKPRSYQVMKDLIGRGLVVKRYDRTLRTIEYQLTDQGREVIIAAKIAQELER